jgi:hypothetical protein
MPPSAEDVAAAAAGGDAVVIPTDLPAAATTGESRIDGNPAGDAEANVDAFTLVTKSGVEFEALISDDKLTGYVVLGDDRYPVSSKGLVDPALLLVPDHVKEMHDAVRAVLVAADPKKPGRKIKLTTASDLVPRKVYWLWHPWVPRGALTLLAGLPGVGKSQVALDYAAKVTRGESDMQSGEPRCVLIYATEDAREHVIVPRLIAARANLDYVHFVSVTETDARGIAAGASLVLPIDQDELAEAIELVSALLVIFDPLMSVLDPAKSANQDRELRTALEPLAATLDRTKCSGMGLAHFRKAGGSAADRVMGGRGFVGVARSVLVAVPDHEAGDIVLSIEKSNYGALGTPGERYRVATRLVTVQGDGGESEDVPTPYVEWLGPTEGSGNDHVRDLLDDSADRARSQSDVAGAWLLEHLRRAGGWAPSEDVKAAATAAKISPSTLQRGRKKHGVLDHTLPGKPLKTVWYLPGVDVSTLTTTVTIAPTPTSAPPPAPSVLGDR